MKFTNIFLYICLLLTCIFPVSAFSQFLIPGEVSPANQTIVFNTVPAPLTATAPSGGSGPYPYVYSYQWQSSTNGSTWTNINGATSGSSYAPGALSVTTYYQLLTTEDGMTYVSNGVTVTVVASLPLQSGSILPTTISINYNTSPGQLTGTAASGGNGIFAYQWQSSPDNSIWSNIIGANAQNYTPGNLTATTYYRRSVTSNGETAYSNTSTVTVYPQLQGGNVSPATISINYNTTPGQLTGTAASGGNGTYSYQWQSSANNSTWINISGATAQDYTPGNLTATTYYRRSVTSNGLTIYSNTSTVTIYGQLKGGSVSPTTKSINYNTGSGQLTGTAASGGNGTYTYQWQSSPNNGTWTDISGATGLNYTSGNLTSTTYYRRSVTSNDVAAYSNTVTINVYPQLLPGTISPASLTINYNTNPGQISGPSAAGGNGTYTYKWQSSVNNSTWTDITGATGLNYTPGNLTVKTYFRRAVISNGVTRNSNVSTITVYAQLQGGSVSPDATSINYGTSPGQLTGTVANGGNGTYTYQWQSSQDNNEWNNISGASTLNYTPGNLTITTYYRRAVTSNGVMAYSNTSTVTVYPQLLAGSLTPGSITINPNTSPGTLGGSTASGGNGTYTWQWQSSADGNTWNNINGATTQDYIAGNLTAVTWYRRSVTSGGITAITQPIVISMYQQLNTVPIAYNSAVNVNYVRTWDITAPVIDPNAIVTRPLKDVKQATAYFDGLGRLLQTVIKQGSLTTGASPVDLVSPVVYDEFDREVYKYLPFAANNTGGNSSLVDGAFKLNPFQQQAVFAAAQHPGESYYYSKTNFEASPLNRIEKVMPPGNNWVGSNRGTDTKYWINTVTDSVRIWYVTGVANNWGTYGSPGAYQPGVLYKNVTFDEHGKQVIEFKDKEGKVILKKVQANAMPDYGTGSGHTGWLCTYYLYDDLNHLRCVIQPHGVALIASNWLLTDATILAEQCFRYEYDDRQRMIRKKVSGAGEVWMVYDQWDRLVLTQDANLRTQNAWLFTKYDVLNRPVYTGKYVNSNYTTLDGMQNYLKTQNLARYENYTPSSALPMYSLNLSFPIVTYNDILTVAYYDDYAWTSGVSASVRSFDNSFTSLFPAADNINFPYPQAVQASTSTKGFVTGSLIRVLDASTMMAGTIFYDEKARVIQTKTENYSGGCDIVTIQYSFSGQPLQTIARYQKSNPNAQTHTVITKTAYDDLGRLLTVKNTINSTIGGQNITKPEQIIVNNEYDALGQLKKKILSPIGGTGGGPLETLVYDYNIRGWLLGANRNYIKDAVTNKFGFELGYDKTSTIINGTTYQNQQFNGNISGLLWKSIGDNEKRKYDFAYDAVNRLTSADFNQFTGSTFNKTAGIDFSVRNLTYDGNGNIQAMQQKGWKLGGSNFLDQLNYSYQPKSNKLSKITDAITGPGAMGDFKDGSNGTTDDYNYDDNGNLKLDNNKTISSITYNHLNLPSVITVTGKGTITYIYDAAGNKLAKTIAETGKPTSTTLYQGGLVYENDTLQLIAHEEGRIRYAKQYLMNGDSINRFFNDYFLRDHLENVRMVLTEQTDTAYYLASMETSYRAKEEKLFANIPQTLIAKSDIAGYPTNGFPVTDPNDWVAKVSGSGQKVGPAIILRVMSGDKIEIVVQSYYKDQPSGVTNNSFDDVLNVLASGIVGATGGSKGGLSELNTTGSPLHNALQSFVNTNNPDILNKPRAYLNWIFLDEQLKYVDSESNARPVGNTAAGSIQPLQRELSTINKNGYLYIYVNNETQGWDVFFDNLTIRHYTGPLLEESHYYPFGLTMAGISSKVFKPNYIENKKGFNGIEQTTEFDLNQYDAFYRTLDPQIGRWWQIDPKPLPDVSPYASMNNNPIVLTDFLGDTTNYYNVKTGDYLGTVYGSQGFNDRTIGAEDFSKVAAPLEQARSKTLAFAKEIEKDPKKLKTLLATINTVFTNQLETNLNDSRNAVTNIIDPNSELGIMSRAVYSEMRGGDANAKSIVAESIRNRADLPDGSYEKADGTYSGIVNKFYDVSNPNNASNAVYRNPYNYAGQNKVETAAWTGSISASLKAHMRLSNVGEGVIFYHSTSSTYRDKNKQLQKIQLNITVNGIKGLWKLKQ